MTRNDFYVAIQGVMLEALESGKFDARVIYDMAEEVICEFYEEYVGYSDDED